MYETATLEELRAIREQKMVELRQVNRLWRALQEVGAEYMDRNGDLCTEIEGLDREIASRHMSEMPQAQRSL